MSCLLSVTVFAQTGVWGRADPACNIVKGGYVTQIGYGLLHTIFC